MKADPLLTKLVEELVTKHGCHCVLLYGSRARGDATVHSDYDLMGVRSRGKALRIARKQDGQFVDIFVFPDRDLLKPGPQHLYMQSAQIQIDKKAFGKKFLRKLRLVGRHKFEPLPPDELRMRQVWLHKMLERTRVGDVEGHYRRAWLLEAALPEYFAIRKKRYEGSKAAFTWLKKSDPATYRLFSRALARPQDFRTLKKLVIRVSRIRI